MSELEPSPTFIVPLEQIPSFEALDARGSVAYLDIFPNRLPRDFISVIGDYSRNSHDLPPPESPLLELHHGVETLRTQASRYRTEEDGVYPKDVAKRLVLATSMQLVLIGRINRGHQNLQDLGYSAEEIAGSFREFINDQDKLAAEQYSDDRTGNKRSGKIMAKDGTAISLDFILGGKESSTESRLERLRSRLRFEWMSSLGIVSVLEQGLIQEAA